MDFKKVLFVSQEVSPYLPDTPNALMGRHIPQGIMERGVEVRTFMPKYGMINERRNQLHEVIRLSGMNLIINDTDHPLIIKVATLQPVRMQVYFIYNEDYFAHSLTKEFETDTSPEDNDERTIFYVRGVIETVRKLRWDPAIIHCGGWISALAPAYMRKIYSDDPSFANARIVYSLYDNEMTHPLPATLGTKVLQDGMPPEVLGDLVDREMTTADLDRLAIENCDAIMQCSAAANPASVELARASGKPFLPFEEGTDLADRCYEFYKSL